MINGIHHVAISTPNLNRLVDFYKNVLGFEIVYETSWEKREIIDQIVGLKNSAARSVMLRAHNTHIELFEYSAPEPVPGDPNRPVCDHGYTHLCFDVNDIDAEYERLLEGGIRFHTPPPKSDQLGSGKIRATYGRDPDGNVIELQEVLDQNSQIKFINEELK